ncbi:polysaccharide lyase [Streptomyces cavernae]|uniref:polysaccharide lyase n=1 Tax=Streptomyces cavernae TaxID=2259034 RepID=UPI000FEBF68C|nr:hypothetical protein [Streptomyces cavernae]
MSSRRQIITAGGAAAATALVAACSDSSGGEPAGHPSASASGTPLSRGMAQVTRFFGPDLLPRDHGGFGLSRAVLLPGRDPVLGPTLRVGYPAGSASMTVARKYGRPEGGAQLYLERRSGPVDSLHLRYYLRFPNGFDFVKGGKLPGLYGGSVTGGQHIPDGTDGMSTRYMWRRNGFAEVYAYLPTSVEHGTSLGRSDDWYWPVDRWTCVEQALHLNTPGRADGSITVTVNGARVLAQHRLTFRTTPRLRIDGVFFSTFFGGDDPSWATPRAQYVDFAAFAISSRTLGQLPGT